MDHTTPPLHPLPTLTFPSESQYSEWMGTLAFLVTLVFQLKDDLTMPLALSIRRYIGLLSGLGILLRFSDLPSNRFCDWCIWRVVSSLGDRLHIC